MEGLAGPLFIAAALVVVAGAPKVTDPGDTTRAMRSVGLPSSDNLVRTLAVAEIGIGVAVIAVGGPLAPPTRAHLVLDVAAAGVAIAAVVSPPPAMTDLLVDQPAFGIPFVAFVALGSWLGYLTLTLLPQLQAARTGA
jgi:uncharacterized membrane protein YphA (DoxX/SURF4 family)